MGKPADTANFEAAVAAVEKYLQTGKWQRVRDVKLLLLGYHSDYSAVLDRAKAAESDKGKYTCIPLDSTPILAPDERPAVPYVKPKLYKKCPICGAEFIYEKGPRKYCSKSCRLVANKRQRMQHSTAIVA